MNNMKEYWINVYQYDTIKNTQFYSHCLPNLVEANFRAVMRNIARPESKCIYRIHVKMKNLIRIRLPNDYMLRGPSNGIEIICYSGFKNS